MDYRALVEQLKFPNTRCQAAEALVKLGDRLALLDLVEAYEMSYEGSSLCLLDAMEALGGAAAVDALFDQAAPEASEASEQVRRILHLMEFFPDEAHLPRLAQALGAADERVRKQARRSLSTQRQTPAWLALLTGLLDAPDPADRRQAVESLARRPEETVKAALRKRLEMETDPEIRKSLFYI